MAEENKQTNTNPSGAAEGTEAQTESSQAKSESTETKQETQVKTPHAEAADVPSSEELAEFKKWKESQQTESEKHTAALSKMERAKNDAESKAKDIEMKFVAASKGVIKESIDDVIALALPKISDKATMEQAIDEVIKKYPVFTASTKPGITTGTKTGGNTQPAASTNVLDLIRGEQVKRK